MCKLIDFTNQDQQENVENEFESEASDFKIYSFENVNDNTFTLV